MHIKLFILLFTIASSCFSQETIPISKIDSPINFFGLKPLRLHPYNNRVVPFDDYNPLYVLINYKDGKNKHFEYFRIDSTKYLVYEFFRSGKGSSNEGLKSSGVMRVTNDTAGVSTTGVRHLGAVENNYTREFTTIEHCQKKENGMNTKILFLVIDTGQGIILTTKKLAFGATIFMTLTTTG